MRRVDVMACLKVQDGEGGYKSVWRGKEHREGETK